MSRGAVKAFEAAYGAKFPNAVAKITDDLDELLGSRCPGPHWRDLRQRQTRRTARRGGTQPEEASPKRPARRGL